MRESGWRFDKFNSMTKQFNKTSETNGLNQMKAPLRS